MTHSPADLTRYLLIQLGFGTLPTTNQNWPIMAEYEQDLPDNMMTLYTITSKDEGRVSVDDRASQTLERFQLRVRAKDHKTGWKKIDDVSNAFNAVLNVGVVIGSSSYLVYSIVDTDDPVPAGPKDTPNSKRNVFTMNGGVRARQIS